jgi:two-component system, cell cycle response regulator
VRSKRKRASSGHASIASVENLELLRVGTTERCRVLVVDDDPLVCTRLCMLLEAAQYEVEVAATGEEALQVLETLHCHIVLTDWEMPNTDGLALCRHLRLQSSESYVYILMLTIRGAAPDLMTGLAAGADDYVVKGAPIDEILARLEIGRRISYGESNGHSQLRGHGDAAPGIDGVTGAYNYEYFLQNLSCEWARSQRYDHCLAVLSCHIDGLRGFADRSGRAAADQQLRTFASVASAAIRSSDWLARTRHDSFMLVLPETKAAGAARAAQKLSALFSIKAPSTPTSDVGFTVTVDVTSVNGNHSERGGGQIDSLLRDGDSGSGGIRKFENAKRGQIVMGNTAPGDRKALN